MKCMVCGNEEMNLVPQSGTPGWAVVLAVLLFPLGLIFLTVKKKPYFMCDKCGHKVDL